MRNAGIVIAALIIFMILGMQMKHGTTSLADMFSGLVLLIVGGLEAGILFFGTRDWEEYERHLNKMRIDTQERVKNKRRKPYVG